MRPRRQLPWPTKLSRGHLVRATLAVALCAAGCRSHDERGQQNSDEPSPGATRTNGIPPDTVKVATLGAEPRAALGEPPSSSDKIATLSIVHGLGSAPDSTKTTIKLTLRWQSVASGQSRFAVDSAEMATSSAKMSAGERQILKSIPRGFELVRGTVRRSRGLVFATQTAGLPTRPSVPWLIELVTIPIPSGRIGVGGKWTVSQGLSRPDQIGRRVRQYEVSSIAYGVVRVRFTGTDTWRPKHPVAAQATGVHVTAHQEKTAGSLQFSVGHVLASSGDVTIHATSTTRMRAPGQPAVEDSVDMVTRVTIRPAHAAWDAGAAGR